MYLTMGTDVQIDELVRSVSAKISKSPVKFAFLYGSVAAGKHTQISDLDIAVYCEDDGDFASMLDVLAGEFSEIRIDMVNLKKLSPIDYYEIISAGRRLFIADEPLYKQEKLRVMREYLDFAGTRAQIMADMVTRIGKGEYGKSASEIKRA